MRSKKKESFLRVLFMYCIEQKSFVICMTVLVFAIPIIFIYILKLYYFMPGEEIGDVGDWISFSGGYIGALLALFGIWGQIAVQRKNEENEKKEKDIGFFKYLVFIIENNIYSLEDDYIFYENISFDKNFDKINYDENMFPKNIIEDYFNTLFKYEWSSLFFLINKNIDRFNEILSYIKTNKNINKTLFKEFKCILNEDAEAEAERDRRGTYTTDYDRYLYQRIVSVESIYNCIDRINIKNRNQKLEDIFSEIDEIDSFDSKYKSFKEKKLNKHYLRNELYETNDMVLIKIELYLFSLFIIKSVIDDSFVNYKYFKKFKELEKFINFQIEFIKILIYLKSNLPLLKANIENEYK